MHRTLLKKDVFAVGSLVRTSLRPMTKKDKTFSPPKFLPYEVLKAARNGNIAPLLQLRGEYTVPKELMKEISQNVIGQNNSHETQAIASGEQKTINTVNKANATSLSTTRSDDHGAIVSLLDLDSIETVSLETALSLHGGESNIVEQMSRKIHSLDIDELTTDIPVLAPAGSKPPLSAIERDLFSAVTVGNVEKVKEMIAFGEVNMNTSHPEHGSTIMHLAAVCLEANQEKGKTKDHSCNSSSNDDDDILNELCMVGENKDVKSMGKQKGVRVEMFELIAKAEPSLINSRAYNGSTPLHWAAGAGNLDAVDWLLINGADPLMATHTWTQNYFSTGSGQTALHWAAQSGHELVVKLLAAAAPLSVVVVDEKGRNAMDIAEQEQTVTSGTYQALLVAGSEEWLELELSHDAPLSRPLSSKFT